MRTDKPTGRAARLAAQLSGMLGFFFHSRVMGKDLPLIASLKLTLRCNLACRGCPFHARAGLPGSHMSYDLAVSSLERLKTMGCPIVIFEGGEPLLWRDGPHSLADLAALARGSFVCIGATTNGTLALDVPVDVLWVSVDGLKPTHDALRSGSFDRVTANIRSSRHPRLYIHFTANSRNFHELPAVAEMFCSLKQVRGMTVQLFYPYGRGEEDLRLSPEQRAEVMGSAIRLKRLGYPIMNSYRSLKAMVRNTWRCHDRLLANVEPDGTISTGCYAKNRGEVCCRECGFTPVAEASGAYDLKPGSLAAGFRLFLG